MRGDGGAFRLNLLAQQVNLQLQQLTIFLRLVGQIFFQFGDASLVGAEPFQQWRLDGFEAAGKLGQFGGGGLLPGQKFTALRGQFLHHGILERVHEVRRKVGLGGIQQRIDLGRRQRLGFAFQDLCEELVGIARAVATADGAGHSNGHLAVRRLDFEGIFLPARAIYFDGNHAADFFCLCSACS